MNFKVGDWVVLRDEVVNEAIKQRLEVYGLVPHAPMKVRGVADRYGKQVVYLSERLKLLMGYFYSCCFDLAAGGAAVNVPKPKKPKKPKFDKTLRKELRDTVGNYGGNTSFALEFKEGTRKVFHSEICYAALAGRYDVKRFIVDVKGQLSPAHIKIPESLKEYKKYFDYIVKRSPFAKVFITKRYATAVKHGLEMNLGYNSSEVVGGLTALRQFTEFNMRFSPVWTMLRKKGYSEDVSSFVANTFRKQIGKPGYTIFLGGHDVFYKEMIKDEIIEFYKSKQMKGIEDLSPCHVTFDYLRIHQSISPSVYGSSGKQTLAEWVQKVAPAQAKGWNGFEPHNEEDIYKFANAVTEALA